MLEITTFAHAEDPIDAALFGRVETVLYYALCNGMVYVPFVK